MTIKCNICGTEYENNEGGCPRCEEERAIKAAHEANRMIRETLGETSSKDKPDTGIVILRVVAIVMIMIVLGLAFALMLFAFK